MRSFQLIWRLFYLLVLSFEKIKAQNPTNIPGLGSYTTERVPTISFDNKTESNGSEKNKTLSSFDYLYESLLEYNLQKMCSIMNNEDIKQIVQSIGTNYTIIAPSDEAFGLLAGSKLDELFNDREKRREFILRHIIPIHFLLNSLGPNDETEVVAMDGSLLHITAYPNGYVINGANVINGDLNVGNTSHLIDIIDKVMYPLQEYNLLELMEATPQLSQISSFLTLSGLQKELITNNTFTIFTPNDEAFRAIPWPVTQQMLSNNTFLRMLIANHIIPGKQYSEGLSGNKLYSIGGDPLTFNSKTVQSRNIVLVNSVPIINADLVANNGVIHVITRIMLPKNLMEDCKCMPKTTKTPNDLNNSTKTILLDNQTTVSWDPLLTDLEKHFTPPSNEFDRRLGSIPRNNHQNSDHFSSTPKPVSFKSFWDELFVTPLEISNTTQSTGFTSTDSQSTISLNNTTANSFTEQIKSSTQLSLTESPFILDPFSTETSVSDGRFTYRPTTHTTPPNYNNSSHKTLYTSGVIYENGTESDTTISVRLTKSFTSQVFYENETSTVSPATSDIISTTLPSINTRPYYRPHSTQTNDRLKSQQSSTDKPLTRTRPYYRPEPIKSNDTTGNAYNKPIYTVTQFRPTKKPYLRPSSTTDSTTQSEKRLSLTSPTSGHGVDDLQNNATAVPFERRSQYHPHEERVEQLSEDQQRLNASNPQWMPISEKINKSQHHIEKVQTKPYYGSNQSQDWHQNYPQKGYSDENKEPIATTRVWNHTFTYPSNDSRKQIPEFRPVVRHFISNPISQTYPQQSYIHPDSDSAPYLTSFDTQPQFPFPKQHSSQSIPHRHMESPQYTQISHPSYYSNADKSSGNTRQRQGVPQTRDYKTRAQSYTSRPEDIAAHQPKYENSPNNTFTYKTDVRHQISNHSYPSSRYPQQYNERPKTAYHYRYDSRESHLRPKPLYIPIQRRYEPNIASDDKYPDSEHRVSPNLRTRDPNLRIDSKKTKAHTYDRMRPSIDMNRAQNYNNIRRIGDKSGSDSRESIKPKIKTITQIVDNPELIIDRKPKTFRVLKEMMKNSGLLDALNRPTTHITIFMPTDDAFDSLSDELLKQIQNNESLLRKVLMQHILGFSLEPKDIKNNLIVKSLNGEPHIINIIDGGKILINGIEVIAVSSAQNGIVYVVDQLLQKPEGKSRSIMDELRKRSDLSRFSSLAQRTPLGQTFSQNTGPYTVFVPTNDAFDGLESRIRDLVNDRKALKDFIQDQVLDGAVYSKQLNPGQQATYNSLGDIFNIVRNSDGSLSVNNMTKILFPDITTGNGVIHIIDSIPSKNYNQWQKSDKILNAKDEDRESERQSVRTSLGEKSGAKRFLNWLNKTGLIDSMIKDGRPYTVIAPNDRAVGKLPLKIQSVLNTTPTRLNNLLEYHVLPGFVDTDQLEDNQLLTTINNQEIRFNKLENVSTLSGAPISKQTRHENILVISVDNVLYPPHGTITDIISKSPILKTLNEIIKSAQMGKELEANGPFTMFAPKDEALKLIDPDILTKLKTESQYSRDFLKKHIIPKTLFTSALPLNGVNRMNTALNGDPLKLTRKPNCVSVNGIILSYADITATNGVLHVIDHVL